jgi:hypothetical protein
MKPNSILTENHPIVKLWNGMQAMGFFPQFKDYADYKADPGRKPDNEKKEPGEVEQRIFNGK